MSRLGVLTVIVSVKNLPIGHVGLTPCLTVVADHDLNGAGLRAASEAADRWQTAGRETHVFQRETPGDFNDAFREINR
jgi:hypothetical protein